MIGMRRRPLVVVLGALSPVWACTTDEFRPLVDAGAQVDAHSEADAAVEADATSAPDAFGPPLEILFRSPVDGAQQVSPQSPVFVLFSEEIDPGSVSNESLVLEDALGSLVSATVVAGTKSATLTPESALDVDSTYTVRVTRTVKDVLGRALAEDSVWSFEVHAGAWKGPECAETSVANAVFRPRIAIDGIGNTLAVWERLDSPGYRIWANRYEVGAGWGTAEVIGGVDSAGGPRIGWMGSGSALAIWGEPSETGCHLWSSSYQPGAGWGSEACVRTTSDPVFGSEVAFDGQGTAMAVWTEGELVAPSSLRVWWNRYQAGSGWGTAERIDASHDDDEAFPQVVFDAEGVAVAVWSHTDELGAHLAASRYAEGSGWSSPEYIDGGNGGGANAQLAADPLGNAVVVWTHSDRVWTSRYIADDGWTTPTPISTPGFVARDPAVVVDGSGAAVAVWAQNESGHYHIRASRFDAESGWGSAVLIETDAANDAWEPNAAVDDSGNVVTVWRGANNSVWANRYEFGVGWGIAESVGTATAAYPDVGLARTGSAMVVWPMDGNPNIWSNRRE